MSKFESIFHSSFRIAIVGIVFLAQHFIGPNQNGVAQTAPPHLLPLAPEPISSPDSFESLLIARRIKPQTDVGPVAEPAVRSVSSAPFTPAQLPFGAQVIAANFFAYLPIIVRPLPSINGIVTLNGEPLANLVLELVQVDVPSNGVAGTIVTTTTTNIQGRYAFSGIPTLPSQKAYYVRYSYENNSRSITVADLLGMLDLFLTRMLYSYTVGENVALEDFDVADIELTLPGNSGHRVDAAFPITFAWTMRPFSTESYEFLAFGDGKDAKFSSTHLGHVNSYQLIKRPAGFYISLRWFIGLRTQFGGEGVNGNPGFVALTSPACKPPALIMPANGEIVQAGPSASVKLTLFSHNTPLLDEPQLDYIYSNNPGLIDDPYYFSLGAISNGGSIYTKTRPTIEYQLKFYTQLRTTYYLRLREYCITSEGYSQSVFSPATTFTVVPPP